MTIKCESLGGKEAVEEVALKTYRVPVYRVQLQRDGSLVREGTREVISSPEIVADLVHKLIGESPQEHFVMLAVDARHKVIGIHEVARGTLTASLVHPRETLRTAILLNAAAYIVSHNHPSGEITPSAEDREATRRLSRAGELMGIALLDHVLVGGIDTAGGTTAKVRFFSFKENGLL